MKARMTLNRNYTIGAVDERLFGSFAEHLGRCVYTGLYEPGHPLADGDGMRRDVLELVRELQVPVVRYPGGNYVSGFRWEDSVGPRQSRPVRMDCAWNSRESNAFGLNEFMSWCRKAGTQPMMALNLGTRGVEAALDLLEYCNAKGGTALSDRRIAHGAKEPHNIRLWCLGNEMDGPWQLGHKTAAEYGRLACETARAMKRFDPALELVLCGGSGPDLPHFPAWGAEALLEAYDAVDYLSLHQYFANRENDTPDFLAASLGMDRHIRDAVAACDYVRAVRHDKRPVQISFDEWNVWFHSGSGDDRTEEVDGSWPFAPAILEDVYNMEDALVVGCALITLLNHADRVKIACLAQLVNVIAPIMTEPGGGVFRQTIFYPFLHASRYGRGTALLPRCESPRYDSRNYTDVPFLAGAAVYDEAGEALTVFAVNRSLTEPLELACRLEGFEGYACTEHLVLQSDDLKAANSLAAPGRVAPTRARPTEMDCGRLTVRLAPASWNVLRLGRAGR